jgi:hypothetical protein
MQNNDPQYLHKHNSPPIQKMQYPRSQCLFVIGINITFVILALESQKLD